MVERETIFPGRVVILANSEFGEEKEAKTILNSQINSFAYEIIAGFQHD
jgi:hypothetical protein